MIRNILVTFMLLTSSSFSQEIKLEIEDKSYRVKDNVFVLVTGQKESLRLKVFGPDLEPVVTYELKEEGKFFFQVLPPGDYLVEASDAGADVFKKLKVLNSDSPLEICPDSKIGKDIYKELKKVLYVGSGSDALEIAKIFAKNKGKKPAQTLINDTFTEVQAFLKDNPKKDEWKDFFAFLQKYYTDLAIPSDQMEKYQSLWEDTEEAFKCKGSI